MDPRIQRSLLAAKTAKARAERPFTVRETVGGGRMIFGNYPSLEGAMRAADACVARGASKAIVTMGERLDRPFYTARGKK